MIPSSNVVFFNKLEISLLVAFLFHQQGLVDRSEFVADAYSQPYRIRPVMYNGENLEDKRFYSTRLTTLVAVVSLNSTEER